MTKTVVGILADVFLFTKYVGGIVYESVLCREKSEGER
jgi:hypothetical protein